MASLEEMQLDDLKRTAGGMLAARDRHLGRARKRKRKIKRKNEVLKRTEVLHWNRCNLCGGNYTFVPEGEEDEYLGHHMCIWCRSRNGKRQIQYMVLVEKAAETPCLRELKDLSPRDNCNCLTCAARKLVARDSREDHLS